MKSKLNIINNIQFSNNFYNKLSKVFKLNTRKSKIIEHFTSGGCFEFAYNYQKLISPSSKLKLLIGIDTDDNGNIEGFDLGHAFINDKGKIIDINGEIGFKGIDKWKNKMQDNEYSEIIEVEYGSSFKNFKIDKKFIENLDPYNEKYFYFSSESDNSKEWENIFNTIKES